MSRGTALATITVTVRVPADTIRRLRERALREDTTVSAIVSRLVTTYLAQHDDTADEALADVIGCCASEDGADARDIEREFGEYLEEKRRTGRL